MTVQKELSGVRVGQGDQPAKWTLVHCIIKPRVGRTYVYVTSARRCGITYHVLSQHWFVVGHVHDQTPIPDTLQSISGVDPPHHGKLAVIYPRILDQRLSRVGSATDVFVLVDTLAEAFVCIYLGTAFLSLLRHARG